MKVFWNHDQKPLFLLCTKDMWVLNQIKIMRQLITILVFISKCLHLDLCNNLQTSHNIDPTHLSDDQKYLNMLLTGVPCCPGMPR